MANTPTITINGRELPYWVNVSIDSSIDALADTFSLSYKRHSQTPKGEANPLAFDGDELAKIHIDGELLLTGYIDYVPVTLSPNGDVVTINGYSKTADLVKCPVLPRSKTFKDQTIESICKSLCEPFGIDVVVDESAEEAAKTKLTRFKAEFGEIVAESLGRVTRYGGLLLFSSPDGGLLLSRAGGERVSTVLRHGQNLEEVSITRDARDRHSEYFVVSDGASGFDPDDADKDDGRVARAADPGVGRYRPALLTSEQDAKTQSQRKTQAEWERNRRAGESLSVSTKFSQWRHSDGVWRPNTLVRFVSREQGLDRDMLVSTVSLSREAGGSVVQLELAHPDSFEPRKIPLPRRRKARAKHADSEQGSFPDAPDVPFYEQTPHYEENYGEQYGDVADYEGDLDYDEAGIDPW